MPQGNLAVSNGHPPKDQKVKTASLTKVKSKVKSKMGKRRLVLAFYFFAFP